MITSRWSVLAAGLPLALLAVLFASQSSAPALAQGNGNGNGNGNPPSREVLVVNTPATAVPVTGAVSVSGTTAISGNVAAAQNGSWSVGIDPARNLVSLAGSPRFDYDSNFGVVNDGATLEFGPFDLSSVRTLRILTRAVNGDVRFQIYVPTVGNGMVLDEFEVLGESGNRFLSRSYDAPPPNVMVRVIESGGPGGANYHFMLVGR